MSIFILLPGGSAGLYFRAVRCCSLPDDVKIKVKDPITMLVVDAACN